MVTQRLVMPDWRKKRGQKREPGLGRRKIGSSERPGNSQLENQQMKLRAGKSPELERRVSVSDSWAGS